MQSQVVTDNPFHQCLKLAGAATLGAAIGMFIIRRSSRTHSVLQQLRHHVSIRKFSDQPVSQELLKDLVSTAVRSSTNGNMQTYSIILTTDPDELQKLAKIHDNDAIGSAKALLTFCSDFSRHSRWCELRNADPQYDNWMAFITGNNDAMVAAQTTAVAAEACGLGICFLGSTVWCTGALCDIFALPRFVHPVTSIMIGWPAERPALRARLPMNGVLHYGQYTAIDDDQVLEAYQSREIEGWKRYEKLYGEGWKQKCRDQNIKNLPQAYTTLKYTGRDYRRWSRLMLQTLEQQGFANNAYRHGDDKPSPHNI